MKTSTLNNRTLRPNTKQHTAEALALLEGKNTAFQVAEMINDIFGMVDIEGNQKYLGHLWLSCYLESSAWRDDAMTDNNRNFTNSFVFGETPYYEVFAGAWDYLKEQL